MAANANSKSLLSSGTHHTKFPPLVSRAILEIIVKDSNILPLAMYVLVIRGGWKVFELLAPIELKFWDENREKKPRRGVIVALTLVTLVYKACRPVRCNVGIPSYHGWTELFFHALSNIGPFAS